MCAGVDKNRHSDFAAVVERVGLQRVSVGTGWHGVGSVFQQRAIHKRLIKNEPGPFIAMASVFCDESLHQCRENG